MCVYLFIYRNVHPWFQEHCWFQLLTWTFWGNCQEARSTASAAEIYGALLWFLLTKTEVQTVAIENIPPLNTMGPWDPKAYMFRGFYGI